MNQEAIIKISDMRRFKKNPNIMSSSKIEALTEAIKREGILSPFFVCKSWDEVGKYVILDGNHRHMICEDLNIEEVKCTIIEEVKTEDDAISFIVRFNDFRGETSLEVMCNLVGSLLESQKSVEEISAILRIPDYRVMRYSTYKFNSDFREAMSSSDTDELVPIPILLPKDELIRMSEKVAQETNRSLGNWGIVGQYFSTYLYEHMTRCMDKHNVNNLLDLINFITSIWVRTDEKSIEDKVRNNMEKIAKNVFAKHYDKAYTRMSRMSPDKREKMLMRERRKLNDILSSVIFEAVGEAKTETRTSLAGKKGKIKPLKLPVWYEDAAKIYKGEEDD